MSELIREPCPCGAGSVVLRHYSPEYMYGTAYSEHGIDCVECRGGYVVQEKFGELHLFRRAEHDRVYELAGLSNVAHDELQTHVLVPMAQRICADAEKYGRTFEKKLSYVQSIFAMPQLSAGALRAEAKSAGSFANWVQQRVNADSVRDLHARLQLQLPVDAFLKAYETRRAESGAYKPVPERIYTRSRVSL